MRTASVERNTAETRISVAINLDGSGTAALASGVPFLDHMLDQIARHGLIDLQVKADGDLHIDAHHTVEDIGITLGQALAKAVGDKKGLRRYGHAYVPLDEALWSVNPFRLTEKDGRLYGLGSTDMKSFFPLIMEALKDFEGVVFRQPLIVLATADEETSMQGARTLAELGRPKARCAVIGEPTGMRPIYAHKGIMMESIDLLGRSGHSSNADLGRNALDAMHEVISELILFRQSLQQRYHSPLFSIPRPTLNLGCIHGGDNPNRICGQCRLEFDLRLLPGMDGLSVIGRLRASRIQTPVLMLSALSDVDEDRKSVV